MVKSKSSYKETFLYCNLLILMGLIGACYYLHTDMDELDNDSVYEGVTNMGCCGGIQGGVHYNETDTKPPPYVRRCFKSFNDDGKTSYNWSGFPCTSSENSDCCDNKGQCIATTKGGYCESSEGKFIFNRRKSESSMYIKRSNDDIFLMVKYDIIVARIKIIIEIELIFLLMFKRNITTDIEKSKELSEAKET